MLSSLKRTAFLLFSVRSVLHRIEKEMSLQERQKSARELLSIIV